MRRKRSLGRACGPKFPDPLKACRGALKERNPSQEPLRDLNRCLKMVSYHFAFCESLLGRGKECTWERPLNPKSPNAPSPLPRKEKQKQTPKPKILNPTPCPPKLNKITRKSTQNRKPFHPGRRSPGLAAETRSGQG